MPARLVAVAGISILAAGVTLVVVKFVMKGGKIIRDDRGIAKK